MKSYIDSRESIILKYIKGKTVLDLGVGDTTDRFLHDFVKQNSKKTVGLEYDQNRAKNLQNKGYDVICGNAETVRMPEQFDIILAGDLIEHLNNPGLFLESVKANISKQGLFIFNTPNAYSINLLLRGIVLRGNVVQLTEHVALFNEQLLRELLDRHGFDVVEVKYFTHAEKKILSMIIRFFSIFGEKWNENILVIAKVRK